MQVKRRQKKNRKKTKGNKRDKEKCNKKYMERST